MELSPIDSSIKVIQEKNEELLTITEQTELSQTWKSPFTMALKGTAVCEWFNSRSEKDVLMLR